MGKLDGKIALVTGGNSGIGLATAKEFVKEDAYVFVTGRRGPELAAAVDAIGENATAVQSDMAKLADLDRLYGKIKQDKGRLDIVFANAGMAKYAALGDISEELYDAIFSINVKGVLFTVQKALPLLNDGASIILAGSTAASVGNEAFGVYGASKAAIRSFGRTWAKELRGRSIRVNTISPGTIDTPGIDGLAADQEKADELKAFLLSEIPLGRLGRPEDVAAAALFLASDQSTFITGIELFVDGGTNQV